MKRNRMKILNLPIFFVVLMFLLSNVGIIRVKANNLTPVEINGQLKVSGSKLLNSNNQPIQLKGMSSFGIQYSPQFVNYNTMKYLRDNWGMNVFRVAMYTDGDGGYIFNKAACKAKVEEAVNAAQKLGIYVIVDWHMFNNPQTDKSQSKDFFNQISSEYKNSPNVIYEIANEPCGDVTWGRDIKPYANEVIPVIRANSPNAIVIVGSPTWSQSVLDPANDPLSFSNVMYACHFYAGTHGQWLRDRITQALNKNIALFATEWGTSDCNGSGGTYIEESQRWVDFMTQNKISWTNWVLDDANATASILKPGSNPNGGWTDNDLTESGKFVKAAMLQNNTPTTGGNTTPTTGGNTTPTTGGNTTPTTGGNTTPTTGGNTTPTTGGNTTPTTGGNTTPTTGGNTTPTTGGNTTPTTGAVIDTSKTYKIISSSTGKVLNVRNYSSQSGAQIEELVDVGALSEQWKIADSGNGSYKITSALSNLSLDGGVSTEGTDVKQYQYAGAENQQWNIEKINANTYKITNKKSNLALETTGVYDSADIQLWNYTGKGTQQWIISDVNAGTNTTPTTGGNTTPTTGGNTTPTTGSAIDNSKTYKIISQNTGKVLNVRNYSSESGAQIEELVDVGALSEEWKITNSGNGSYKITSALSNFSLDAGTSTEGSDVKQYQYTGAESQQWNIEKIAANTYKITNKKSGLALNGTGAWDGSNLQLAKYSSTADQQWILKAVN
ncbi:endoglucanase [Clostridium acetobutylicum]|uniref:Endo-1,4-beta glucanase (Fused to two ricin-B-like domains) n=1 Tax=Clostridium acetobutylicum (strain ATCC 824 / DSM 792 / JCM 1419 / IAM 19013 / LMG 5710 / NBRC 13948 / NRRL B-527 / VKM B-1787 / 2291 / W) TaxID=272562 RepID=Q97L56_CLOAB|nr:MULTISPECIES: cellulase family glycosylhydrolase [Clostridium]AAK78683.1 Endo-1,4-beta glucanase (fused to two ricin-B-like domains) [Clostridium acetobutylicum ATCC 824]ADZ19756.1 Endo-1,4-beta glucanase (fused to two ricin-B-like domains) [Clostridium acetobutylicum EA 2018]AEI34191.1 endo-1,4-beta glucanase [Clostridium acetobutylicum DSM 1731]AWV80402.1 1,4-beta-glucanase [Clostridium acetobutylicum]MBC2392591.1 cellulase family glycosylhydrolase [Clostridium acetobutylicum]